MLLQILTILFSCSIIQAMEKIDYHPKSFIYVYNKITESYKEPYKIAYTSNTTVLNIKQEFEKITETSVAKQKLLAVIPAMYAESDEIAQNVSTLSDDIEDNLKIREVIENYGEVVKVFELYLKTHKNPYKNN